MWYLFAALAISVGNLVLHKPISDVCDAVLARVGFLRYDRGALLVISGLSVLAAAPIALRRRQPLGDPVIFAALVVLAAVTVAAQHWLLVTNIEIIHFPQFALIAGLLYAGGLSPRLAWLAATAAGVADEVYQYLVIYAGRNDVYLDFNDMLLNAIGAAWMIVLAAGGDDREEPRQRVATDGRRAGLPPAPARWWLLGGLMAALAAAWWVDPPPGGPRLREAATGRWYLVLSLPEALLAVAALGVLVCVAAPGRPARRV